jgi:XisH protein
LVATSCGSPYTPTVATIDAIHNAVKNALIKDGWIITADPYTIKYEEVILFADLGAERPLAAERAGRKIVVEVKSFLSPSPIHDLKLALGQYTLYLGFLELIDPDRKLYLAISEKTYTSLFAQKAIQIIVQRYQLSLLVVNVDIEEVVTWTN